MEIEIRELCLRYASLRIRDPQQRARLLSSLSADGQQAPVVVVRDGEHYVLIDGYARVGALRALGHDLVETLVLEVSEAEALIRTHGLEGQRARSALEEGWLLEELTRRHRLSQQELGKRLGRSRSWVSRRLALVTVLPESVQARVREGKLSSQVATKYLVPLARANGAQCARLVDNFADHSPTVREMKRLYVAWRVGDREQRERIVNQPRLFLKVTDDDKTDDATTLLLRDLRVLGAVSQRSEQRIEEGAWKNAASDEQPRLERAWAHVQRNFTSLKSAMEPWEAANAGPGHAGGDPASSA